MGKTERLNASTGWTPCQRNHLRRLVKAGATIAYVVTDRHGRPANGGPATREWQVRAGLIQTLPGPLRQTCGQGALHGTLEPHRWKGERCWLAGWVGEVVRGDYKLWGLHREIIGEVYPETALSDSVGARIGRRDLSGAYLSGAYLYGANLDGAYLYGANLSGANLSGANLYGAYLYGANLDGAYLYGANLSGANLYGANLYGANLDGANLYGANLSGAYLYGANLDGANLDGAYLSGANLSGANRSNAKAVTALVDAGWENAGDTGVLRRKGAS